MRAAKNPFGAVHLGVFSCFRAQQENFRGMLLVWFNDRLRSSGHKQLPYRDRAAGHRPNSLYRYIYGMWEARAICERWAAPPHPINVRVRRARFFSRLRGFDLALGGRAGPRIGKEGISFGDFCDPRAMRLDAR